MYFVNEHSSSESDSPRVKVYSEMLSQQQEIPSCDFPSIWQQRVTKFSAFFEDKTAQFEELRQKVFEMVGSYATTCLEYLSKFSTEIWIGAGVASLFVLLAPTLWKWVSDLVSPTPDPESLMGYSTSSHRSSRGFRETSSFNSHKANAYLKKFGQQPLSEDADSTSASSVQAPPPMNEQQEKEFGNRVTHLADNTYGLVAWRSETKEWVLLSSIVFIRDFIVHIPNHVVDSLIRYYNGEFLILPRETDVSTLSPPGSAQLKHYLYEWDKLSKTLVKNIDTFCDAWLVEIKNLRTHTDIVRFFIKEKEICSLDLPLVLAAPLRLQTGRLASLFEDSAILEKSTIRTTPISVSYGRNLESTMRPTRLIQTEAWSQPGDCDTVLFRFDVVTPFLGLHIAKQNPLSFCLVVTQEMWNGALQQFSSEHPNSVLFKVTADANDGPPTGPTFGTVSNSVQPIFQEVSRPRLKLTTAGLSGKFPFTGYPVNVNSHAHPDTGEWIEPRKNAFAKLQQPHVVLTQETAALTELAAELYLSRLFPVCFNSKVLTLDEILTGDETKSMPRINLKSDSGFSYAYCKDKRTKKSGLVTRRSDGSLLIDPLFRKKVSDLIDEFATDDFPSAQVFVDKYKLELRPKSKVDKPRLYSVPPFELNCLFKMYFWDVVHQIRSGRIVNGICIGLNPYGSEWTILKSYLDVHASKNNEPDTMAGDFSCYDASLLRQIFDMIGDFILARYAEIEPQNARIRRVIWEALTSSYHLNNKTMYRWTNGNPSGSPFTSELNSIYNNIVFYYVFMRLSGKRESIEQMFSFTSYGDDNLWRVQSCLKDLFEPSKVTQAYRELGMTYTDFTKQGDAYWHHLSETSFLKRGFQIEAGHLVAPIDKDALYNMVSYTKFHDPSNKVFYDRVKTALFESSLHGKEFFDEFRQKLIPYVSERDRLKTGYPMSWERAFRSVREWVPNFVDETEEW